MNDDDVVPTEVHTEPCGCRWFQRDEQRIVIFEYRCFAHRSTFRDLEPWELALGRTYPNRPWDVIT